MTYPMMRTRRAALLLAGLAMGLAWASPRAAPASDRQAPPAEGPGGGQAGERPRGAPAGLRAEVDAEGRVVLTWQRDPTPDAVSYLVYRASGPDAGWVPVANVPASSLARQRYRDRLPAGPARTYAYRVSGVGAAGTQGEPSEAVEVRPPDRDPPAPPILTALEPEEGGIRLGWAPPPDPDVAGYRVYRRAEGAADWEPATEGVLAAASHLDAGVRGGVLYSYAVAAVDASGNEGSRSRPRSQRALGAVMAVPPGTVAATAEGGRVRLSWAGLDSPDLRGYLVDRGPSPEGPFEQVSGLVTEPVFADPRSGEREGAWYRVRAFYRGGRVSEASEAVEWRAEASPTGKDAR